MSDNYTPYRVVVAEGARVGFTTCLRCGATLLLDRPEPDPVKLHNDWHAHLEAVT